MFSDEQRRRELAQLGQGAVEIADHRLDADMVGARLAVGADACGDRVRVAPRDQRVDQAVAAAVGEVGVAEAVLAPAVV